MIDLSFGTIVDNRYQLIEHLGQGGMGTVFKTRELGLERIIALKLLHPSLVGDTESQQRFKREGKVLSELNHPNILIFYRFGVWGDAFPYIAMEFVQGQSLSAVIGEQGISPNRVVAIGLQICAAMEHAHRHKVIHRDLKPSNIMLCLQPTADTVKIVDFGLARVLPDANATSRQWTQTGSVIGSVHYMSPEQCLGKKADVRSDIYSLGCLLYEAVTGCRPLDADNPIGLMHLHATQMPEPISKRLGDAMTPAGLNNVLVRSMMKDPAQRYQSMAAMQEDLSLVLSGQGGSIDDPGKATKSSGRFSIMPGVGVLCALLFLILASILGYCILLRNHNNEEMAVLSTHVPGPLGAEHFKNLGDGFIKQCKFPEAELAFKRALDIVEKKADSDRSTLRVLVTRLGYSYRAQGKQADARSSFTRALSIGKTIPEFDNANLLVSLGNVCTAQGRYREAEVIYKKALTIMEKNPGRDTSSLLVCLSDTYRGQARYAEAAALSLQVLALCSKKPQGDRSYYTFCLGHLGSVYQEQRKYAEAEALYKRALAVGEKELGRDSCDLVCGLVQLGGAYREDRKYAEAEASYKRSLVISEKTPGSDSSNLLLSLRQLAEVYQEQGKNSQAESLYMRVLGISEKIPGPDSSELLHSLRQLAGAYQKEGKYGEAESLFKRALDISEKTPGPDNSNLLQSLKDLSRAYKDQGNIAAAEQLFKAAMAIIENDPGQGESSLPFYITNSHPTSNTKKSAEELCQELTIREYISGVWQWFVGGQAIFYPNGTVTLGGVAGMWTAGPRLLRINWSNGHFDTVRLCAGNQLRGFGGTDLKASYTSSGAEVWAKKIRELRTP